MNKLTAEKCREQFEEWFRKHYCIPGQFCRHDKSGDYENLTVRASWRAWQASRDAIPILEQQERGEGDVWIHWNGEMALPPVDSHVRVEVKRRNGETSERQAKWFAWRNGPVKSGFDIIAYRITPEREESCSN